MASSRTLVAAVFGCVGLAALLRLPGLGTQSLWLDEICSIDTSTWSLPTILTVGDSQPPLYPLLLKLLRVWWPFDVTSRVVSAVVGTISVGLIFTLGKRLWGRRTGTLAALILAISPLHVWYSREGRVYALFVLWSILSTLCLEAVVRGNRRGALLGYALATACGLTSHYCYIAVVAAQIAFLFLLGPGGVRTALLAAGTVGAIILVLVLPFLASDLGGTPGGRYRVFTWLALPYTGFAFMAGFGVGPSLEELHRDTTLAAVGPYWPEVTLVAVTGVLLTLAGLRALRDAGAWGRYLVLWLVLPVAFGLVAARITGHPFNVRYVIGALPAFALLLALGLAAHGRVFAVAGVAALVAIAALSIGRDRLDPRYGREDLRGAGRYLESVVAPGDTVVVTAAETAIALGHYFHGPVHLGRLPAPTFASVDDAAAEVRRLADGGHITWLVLSRDWEDDPHGFVRRDLDIMGQAPSARLPGVRIYRLGT
jgi:4-amino-4-deoxy-L-arabinose transferase-like glycosyltransferase